MCIMMCITDLKAWIDELPINDVITLLKSGAIAFNNPTFIGGAVMLYS